MLRLNEISTFVFSVKYIYMTYIEIYTEFTVKDFSSFLTKTKIQTHLSKNTQYRAEKHTY